MIKYFFVALLSASVSGAYSMEYNTFRKLMKGLNNTTVIADLKLMHETYSHEVMRELEAQYCENLGKAQFEVQQRLAVAMRNGSVNMLTYSARKIDKEAVVLSYSKPIVLNIYLMTQYINNTIEIINRRPLCIMELIYACLIQLDSKEMMDIEMTEKLKTIKKQIPN